MKNKVEKRWFLEITKKTAVPYYEGIKANQKTVQITKPRREATFSVRWVFKLYVLHHELVASFMVLLSLESTIWYECPLGAKLSDRSLSISLPKKMV